ncbi:DASS family sodium-coupled anion symporter [Sulfurospirillum arcachonense]|uniref:DASS family sodium-coupled anion symporter n=1 Tax=Sulfurospirillum arcachonense TaxID=57666 RepID=UPI00046AC166|nr:DASS family sodium-coupled anion symporter [Sulfurospirillum arcachonense]
MSKTAKMIIPLVIGIVVAICPTPEGLSTDAQYFFAIFLGLVAALVLEPIPGPLLGLISVMLVAGFGLIGETAKASRSWALSGFSSGTVWLIFAAFMFALGYKKSGLGKRIALILIKLFGKTSLGLGYAVAFADLLLSPFIPSNTARSGGTIFPIAVNIPELFDSTPDNNPEKIGSYISWVALATTCVTSSMFLTALAPNILAIALVEKGTGILINWNQWFTSLAMITIPLFLAVPLITYLIYPPEQKHSPEAPIWADKELKKIGKITQKEFFMLGLGFLAVLMWVFSDLIGINGTISAIIILCLLILTNVFTWEDVISNKGAFHVFIFVATLVTMAGGLKKVGFLKWISGLVAGNLTGMEPLSVAITLLVLFFVFHYFFASITAHTVALLPLFLGISLQLLPTEMIQPLAMLLVGSLGFMGVLTPYTTGPAQIWYGAGYIRSATWWKLGAIFGAIYLASIIILAYSIL